MLFDLLPWIAGECLQRERDLGGGLPALVLDVWFDLEDLHVDESHRGRGYGRALIAELARVCVERGYSRLEWTVLDWNAPAIAFYRYYKKTPPDDPNRPVAHYNAAVAYDKSGKPKTAVYLYKEFTDIPDPK